jgi:transcriptional regulator with XRE-family HTH domain
MTLKEWKLRNKLSYAALGEALGISKSFAFKISRGEHFPRLEVQDQISEATNGAVSSDDLRASARAWRDKTAKRR